MRNRLPKPSASLIATALAASAFAALPATAGAAGSPSPGGSETVATASAERDLGSGESATGSAARPAGEAASAQASRPRERRARSGPVPARIRIKLSGLSGGKAGIMKPVRVRGSVAPYVAGRKVEVIFFRNGKPARRKVVDLRRGGDNYGVFEAVVRPDRAGKWAAGARVRPNRVQRGAHTKRRSWKLSYPTLREGQCGPVVVGFKRALSRMGYITNGGPCMRGRTMRGVLAYRKVNDMSRNFRATSSLVRDVYAGRGSYKVRHPNTPGVHMEVPLSKQVLVFAKGNRPVAIYPISSGKPSTPTVTGSWQMDWTQPGYNNLDMYWSWYFFRGYAIHGYKSVPNYPASNGCLRTFEADQPEIFNRISKGDWIHIW